MRLLVILVLVLASVAPPTPSAFAADPIGIFIPAESSLVGDHPVVAGITAPGSNLRITLRPGHPLSTCGEQHFTPIEPAPGELLVLTTTANSNGVFAVGPLTLPATTTSRYWEVTAAALSDEPSRRWGFYQTAAGFGLDAPTLVSLDYELFTTGTPLQVRLGLVGGTPPFSYAVTWPDGRAERGTTFGGSGSALPWAEPERTIPLAHRFTESFNGEPTLVEAQDARGLRASRSMGTFVGLHFDIFEQHSLLEVSPAAIRPADRPGGPAATITLGFRGKNDIRFRLSARSGDSWWVLTSDGGSCTGWDTAWIDEDRSRQTFTWDGWDNTLVDNPAGRPVPFPPSDHHHRAVLLLEWYAPGFKEVAPYRREIPLEILPWRP